ncbi:N-acetylmuramoyl-L-alanine amidase [Streptomyces iconiensis]|uniref:N-acetylmuramoyl-L-alanine amidase n=1 Tax=Streptomyces iconiensis TaxID=1384038 RepID=A0ABT6ZV64_9ACTN|nr:peptidoglycan recognition family protein [Streptomyces iconiensis]MDJ1132948.1 peptidoglycan recognition family protein [Streptomyces iconiensis]
MDPARERLARTQRNPHAPSRRALLRGAGGLALAAGFAGASLFTAGSAAASTRSAARSRDVDYPQAEWVPAAGSNYTVANRPSQYPVEYVVIHVTQTTYADALAIFQNPAKKVSAHYVLRSADGHAAQMVREKDVAWHAGNWDYNTRSVGIEHEGWIDEPGKWFTDAMYEASAALTANVCDRHGIPKDRAHIIGHNEVPGADHTDPGPHWDWARYLKLVNGQ